MIGPTRRSEASLRRRRSAWSTSSARSAALAVRRLGTVGRDGSNEHLAGDGVTTKDNGAGVLGLKSLFGVAGAPAVRRDPFDVLGVAGLEDAGEDGICTGRAVVGDREGHGW